MLDQFKDTFREEAFELLSNFEDLLLQLEEHPEDDEAIAAVFRTMHTIKGSAAMFGFSGISNFTHDVETVLDSLRQGELKVSKTLIDTALTARDHIRLLLEDDENPDLETKGLKILDTFKSLSEHKSVVVDDLQNIDLSKNLDKEKCNEEATFRIIFRPSKEIAKNGTNVLLILRELESMGQYTCIPRFYELPGLKNLDEELCYMGWDIILTTDHCLDHIKDIFIFVENDSQIEYKLIDSMEDLDEDYKRLGEILLDRGIINKKELEEHVGEQKKIGEILEESGVKKEDITSALQEQEHVRKTRGKLQQETASIRVNSEKLDTMVDLVGELVTLQARLNQLAVDSTSGQLVSISEQFERLVSDLRNSTMGMRMIPIGSTFNRFKRMIRDLSNDLGKDVQLLTNGGETELDKNVIDRLNDPLVHILRNSLDHGFEDPKTREENGKPGQGTLMLSAYQAGASVCIEVEDNGRGIDVERVYNKALDNGVVTRDMELSEQEKLELIFHPGLSTAQNVTSVSGRGVGMDVVKKELESLGGTINIYSSLGEGTRVTLKIPLTLAIIEGLLVQVGSNKYVFPLSVVQEVIEYIADPVKVGADNDDQSRGDIVNNRGEVLPFISLNSYFEEPVSDNPIKQIIVATINDSLLGFCVDKVIGDHQTVIKNLGKLYKDVAGVSGATILGDGTVALIVDVQKISTVI